MKSSHTKLVLALVALAFAALLFWRQSSRPAVNLRPSNAVGEVLADEVSRLLDGKGRIVLVGRSASRDAVDARSAQITSLQAALKRRGSPQVAATEWLPRPPVGTMDLGGVNPEQLLELIDKNKDASAFVIFAGLPPLSQDLASRLTARSLKLLAVCGYSPTVRRWLEARALSVAVIPRSEDLPPGTPTPKTPRDWFQREFEMITPDNLAQLGQ